MFSTLMKNTPLAVIGSVTVTSAYCAYNWVDEYLNASADKEVTKRLDDARVHLEESCTLWEAELKRAIMAGDAATAGRLREVLKRAYETLESYDSSFTKLDSPIRLERLKLEQAFGHSDAGSEAGDSFTSATGDEQDLTGFADLADCPANSGSPKRSPSRPPSATADVQPDLWREAQKLAAAGKVPVRKLRLEYTGTSDAADFAAKMHCTRLGMAVIFDQPHRRDMIRDSFMHALDGILIKGGENPKALRDAVGEFERFLRAELLRDNLAAVTKEMKGRGCKELNFYDVVVDFLLFDAFDLIKAPPVAVTSTVQNAWLPLYLRSKALRSTVWGLTKARLQLFPDGTFMKHFYRCMVHLVPGFAAGLLGVGERGFVELNTEYRALLLELMSECFSHPGTCRDLTPELMADKMMESFQRFVQKTNTLITKSLSEKSA